MKKLNLVFLVLLLALVSDVISAQVQPVDKDHLAIGGYDVVSYFTANKATKGNAVYTVTHDGANYYFDSAKTKKHSRLIQPNIFHNAMDIVHGAWLKKEPNSRSTPKHLLCLMANCICFSTEILKANHSIL